MVTGLTQSALGQVRVYLKGGLGNQLFSLAAAVDVADQVGFEVAVSTALLHRRPIETSSATKWDFQVGQLAGEMFSLDASQFQSVEGSTITSKTLSLMEKLSHRLPGITHNLGLVTIQNFQHNWASSKTPKVVRLLGLFMDPSIARNSSAIIKAHLEKLSNPSEAYAVLKKEMSKVKPNVIHYRSGDYENMRNLYGSLSKQYFKEAANVLGSQSEYWLFTDHHDAQSLASDLPIKISRVIDHKQPMTALETMHLLGMGSGFVGSNSTFSFWSALLANSPTQPIFPSSLDARHRVSALIPEDWSWQILDSSS